MINPLTVASNGYLYRYTKKALSVSVDGYLIETIVPPSPSRGIGIGGGGGGINYKSYEKTEREKEDEKLKGKLLEEDMIIEAVIRSFLISQN